ncbi:MAG: hypothetical protein Q4B52_07985 [Tissierellia bacterium]|nr:hypothetical protein [Tissierellia bacterium]
MFLTDNAIFLLNEIRSSVNGFDRVDSFDLDRRDIEPGEFIGTLKYLESIGFIELNEGINNRFVITLTFKGKYYERIKAFERKKYIKESIITPIFVSVVVSFITSSAIYLIYDILLQLIK